MSAIQAVSPIPSLVKNARLLLEPTLGTLGYQEAPSNHSLVHQWQRRLDPACHMSFFLQRHHRPWLVDWNGNSFSAGFSLQPAPPSFSSLFDGRVWFLVTAEERAAMREIHDAVIARLPAPTGTEGLLSVEIDGILDQHRLLARPWLPTQEVMMRYRTLEDLRAWLSFLRELLPSLEARLLKSLQDDRMDA